LFNIHEILVFKTINNGKSHKTDLTFSMNEYSTLSGILHKLLGQSVHPFPVHEAMLVYGV